MRAREFIAEISADRLERYLARADQHVSNRMDRMSQARQRLSKSYEIYHADRPAGSAQIVDRFEADTPEQARQYYEKFIQTYDSDVDFDLRLRKGTGIMEDAEDHEGMQLRLSKDSDGVAVRASAGGKELGMAEFFFDEQGRLDPQTVWVDERFQRQGIARVMYDYLKSKGYTIIRSWDQTDAGKGFWDKHRGEEAQVWENFADGKKPGRKGLAKRSGVDCKQSVTKLRSIAANSTGEKQRMAHWCANMKSGKKK